MNKFYTFDQNNSGGYFIKCAKTGISEFVIIEARDADHAQDIFDGIGSSIDGFDNYCECCGPRWEQVREADGEVELRIYDKEVTRDRDLPSQDILENKPCFGHAYVHPLDEPFYSVATINSN
jgi:hypothetical protein